MREPEYLGAAGKILAGEFTRPGQQIAVRRLVAVGKHLQNCRVSLRQRQYPVFGDAADIFLKNSIQLVARVGNAVEFVSRSGWLLGAGFRGDGQKQQGA